jgi:hypothetical protein
VRSSCSARCAASGSAAVARSDLGISARCAAETTDAFPVDCLDGVVKVGLSSGRYRVVAAWTGRDDSTLAVPCEALEA